MIKYVYAFKNIKSSNFGNPVFEVVDKDNAVEAYVIAAKEGDEAARARFAELDLYYLGSFDTKTAKMDLVEPEFLVSLKEVFENEGTKES